MRRVLAIMGCAAVASCQTGDTKAKLRDPGSVEQVEFYVGGAFRPAARYHVKSFHKVGVSLELAPRFHGLALHDSLGAGEYAYVLEPDDTAAYPASDYSLRGSVDLWGPDNWITLQMPDDPVGGDDGEVFVRGRVQPAPSGGGSQPVWVRLQNVVDASQFRQARVGADGSFQILAGRLTGNFVVTVCRGDDVLYLGAEHFVRTHPDYLDIKLAPKR